MTLDSTDAWVRDFKEKFERESGQPLAAIIGSSDSWFKLFESARRVLPKPLQYNSKALPFWLDLTAPEGTLYGVGREGLRAWRDAQEAADG